MGAPLKAGRRNLLGVFYDEVARESWAEKPYNGSHSFDVHNVCKKLDQGLLHQAEVVYDQVLAENAHSRKSDHQVSEYQAGYSQGGSSKFKGAGKGGKGKRERACFICGDPDHLANQCPRNEQGGEQPAKRRKENY